MSSDDLPNIIDTLWSDGYICPHKNYMWAGRTLTHIDDFCRGFVCFPLQQETVEVPAMLSYHLIDHLHTETCDVVLPVISSNMKSRFSTPTPILKSVAAWNYATFLTIDIDDHRYYAAKGLVIDGDRHVIMACDWELRKIPGTSSHGTPQVSYAPTQPVLRISPRIFGTRIDRFCNLLTGKFLNACLVRGVKLPTTNRIDHPYSQRIKVIVDDMPFVLTPMRREVSMATTNDSLMDIVRRNIAEVKVV